jgi:hypothetical protein
LLKAAPLAPAEHPYLQLKQARPGNLRIVPENMSAVPTDANIIIGKNWKESTKLRKANLDKLVFTAGDLLLSAIDINGEIRSVQSIQGNGLKRFAAGGAKQDAFHVVGGQWLDALGKSPAIVIREGYATVDKRKLVAHDLKRVYTAATENEAEQYLAEFEEKWDDDYPPIAKSWRDNWARITPFFDYPPEIRRIIYTTNAIELVNMSLRKVTKSRGSFPHDDAVMKLFYLALPNISRKWTMPLRDWKPALNRFTIQFEGRMPPQ